MTKRLVSGPGLFGPGNAPKNQCCALFLGSLFALLVAFPAVADGPVHQDAWQAALEDVAPAVVVLRVRVPRAFDTQKAAYERATGFVVDAELGIILTNRHVVNPGPVAAEAVFLNHEEVEVRAVYRDPIHDFGFYRYDPDDVEFMKPNELLLVPEHARVGTEIRVVGNDAGEKLSILSGTLARLDREAPRYGKKAYNDFNTFYFQAASGTSGGSSGSPVVDVHGHAVALNAGGNRVASSSYYLPLDRIVRALEYVQRGESVPRGTIQTVFVRRPYDELRRLGLRGEVEAKVRRSFPDATGMLVVDEVVPGGPADGKLEIGDILLSVGDVSLTSFLPLDAFLDDHVDREIALKVERAGATLSTSITVKDLSSITPERYLEIGGGILHPLSYQQARNHAVAVEGLYLALGGYAFTKAGLKRGAVITELNGDGVESLADFEARWAALPNGAKATVRYFELENPKLELLAVVTVDRLWFPMQLCIRDDATGGWPCSISPAPPEQQEQFPATTSFNSDLPRPMRDLAPSLVMVEFNTPFRIDGLHSERFKGTGLVVDAERGLVVVDRETIPVALGDVRLVFASSVDVPGEVVFIHPVHNLAVVAYDPWLLGDTPIRSARLRPKSLESNDEVWVVGLSPDQELVSRKSRVSTVEDFSLPLTNPPRFRQANLEVALLTDSPTTVGGVLADKKGRVHAYWASFSTGVPPQSYFGGIGVEHIEEILKPLREGRPVGWRTLGAEWRPITLADARSRGLSEASARKLEAHDSSRRVLAISRLTAGMPSAEILKPGDLLLAVDGKPIATFEEIERAGQQDEVRLTLLRDGEEMTLPVPTTAVDGRGTDRALFWAGAVLQAPHSAINEQGGIEPKGVYVAWFWYGSPANRYGLSASRLIVAVDDRDVTDLDSFLAAVVDRPDRSSVRLRTVSLDGRTDVMTLKLDLEFWPTTELRRNGKGWERISHPPSAD
ncbi:MAG: trypsin-like peptidase domain-containing protein [Deltaproteobacteria bacterium]|nr:trypsin-like peptidase domain-containing protein [Deltaproteobacteria bacterium]MBW2691856.1 trypsin-like peptidase domain-containing protein [Deltaproteobacteria bacterium]